MLNIASSFLSSVWLKIVMRDDGSELLLPCKDAGKSQVGDGG